MLEGGQKGSVAAFWFYLPPSLLERDNQNSHVVCSYSHLGPCPLPLCLIVWTRIPGWTTLRSLPSHKI